MKMFLSLFFVAGLSYANECFDVRTTRVSQCPEGQQWFAHKGQCKKQFYIEALFCADKEKPQCKDIRTTFFPPCQGGEIMKFAQGRCPEAYQTEYAYCVVRKK